MWQNIMALAVCQPLRHLAPVIETEMIETGHAAAALGGAAPRSAALVIETELIVPVAALDGEGHLLAGLLLPR